MVSCQLAAKRVDDSRIGRRMEKDEHARRAKLSKLARQTLRGTVGCDDFVVRTDGNILVGVLHVLFHRPGVEPRAHFLTGEREPFRIVDFDSLDMSSRHSRLLLPTPSFAPRARRSRRPRRARRSPPKRAPPPAAPAPCAGRTPAQPRARPPPAPRRSAPGGSPSSPAARS